MHPHSGARRQSDLILLSCHDPLCTPHALCQVKGERPQQQCHDGCVVHFGKCHSHTLAPAPIARQSFEQHTDLMWYVIVATQVCSTVTLISSATTSDLRKTANQPDWPRRVGCGVWGRGHGVQLKRHTDKSQNSCQLIQSAANKRLDKEKDAVLCNTQDAKAAV